MIWAMAEDPDGNLWIATNEGVNRMDRSIDTPVFDQFYSDPNNQLSLKSDNVVALYADDQGNVWIGHRRGGNKQAHIQCG